MHETLVNKLQIGRGENGEVVETLDTQFRSFVKSITWRTSGILVLGGISWVITGSWIQTTYITVAFNAIQVILYYFHERLWERTNWGKS